MAKKIFTDPPPPQEGGAYQQDPVTGELVRVIEGQPTQSTTEADQAAAEE